MCHWPGATSTSPRATSSWDTPDEVERHAVARPDLGAVLVSGSAWPRTRTVRLPWARVRASSSTRTRPPVNVPVTTVPAPFAANARSIHSRGRPTSAAVGVSIEQPVERDAQLVDPDAVERSRPRRSAAASRNVPATCSSTSRRASSRRSSSAIADLGEHDDAMVARRAARGCGGAPRTLRLPAFGGRDDEDAGVDRADTGEHVLDEPNVAGYVDDGDRAPLTAGCDDAKPRSMVSPRAFSSAQRSGSMPVSVRTSVDLP